MAAHPLPGNQAMGDNRGQMAEADLATLLQTLDPDPYRRGKQFERVCRWYLLNDPVYRAKLTQVWPWDDWRATRISFAPA